MVYDRCTACLVRSDKCLLPDSHRAQSKHVWCVDFLLGGAKGKRIRKQMKPGVTKKEAEKYEHITIADFERGMLLPTDKSKTLFKEVIDKYFNEHLYPNSRSAKYTLDYYYRAITELLGHYPIGSIKLDQLQAVRVKFQKENGSSNSNVNRFFSIVKTILNRAVEWEYIQASPAKFLRYMSVVKSKPRFLTVEEINRLWVEFRKDKRVEDLAVVLIHTAIRPIDIKSMNWDQIDFQNKLIHVTTYKGRQPRAYTIPMDNEIEILIQRRFKETGGIGKVFNTAFNHTIIENMIKASGINEGRPHKDRFTFYGLKHSFVSHLLMSGASLYDVSKLVNVSVNTLEKHYGHLTQEHLRAVQSRINLTPQQAKFEVI